MNIWAQLHVQFMWASMPAFGFSNNNNNNEKNILNLFFRQTIGWEMGKLSKLRFSHLMFLHFFHFVLPFSLSYGKKRFFLVVVTIFLTISMQRCIFYEHSIYIYWLNSFCLFVSWISISIKCTVLQPFAAAGYCSMDNFLFLFLLYCSIRLYWQSCESFNGIWNFSLFDWRHDQFTVLFRSAFLYYFVI